MTEPEQRHIISAFAFEFAKVETKAIRQRMLGHLAHVDVKLHDGIADALGMKEQAEPAKPTVAPRDFPPSPPLSILGKAPKTLEGRKIGVLIADGFSGAALGEIRAGAKEEKASVVVIATKVGGAADDKGKMAGADVSLSGAPSVLFDSVVVLASEAGAADLSTQAVAVDWVRDAYGHLKVIGRTPGAQVLFDKAGVQPDAGIVDITPGKGNDTYLGRAREGRIWSREPTLRRPG